MACTGVGLASVLAMDNQPSRPGDAGRYPTKVFMPHSKSKISSTYISETAMRDYIDALHPLLTELYGDQLLTASYGWACNLHNDLLYLPMRVPIKTFNYFMEDSIDQKIYEIGRSDLTINSPSNDIQITLCHESDIHLDGVNDASLDRLSKLVPHIEFKTAEQWSVDGDSVAGSG